ncbi:hypothetical protein FQA47_009406 [Oryzias melastigma]|uniref:Uncharacterized protein n=1 Tax=Oryzias melastigma TaxID=30732 RepID=A0A834CC55_ORYME|nr:hypothetical protein FQA47_009406 [Oryzias melastigma]
MNLAKSLQFGEAQESRLNLNTCYRGAHTLRLRARKRRDWSCRNTRRLQEPQRKPGSPDSGFSLRQQLDGHSLPSGASQSGCSGPSPPLEAEAQKQGVCSGILPPPAPHREENKPDLIKFSYLDPGDELPVALGFLLNKVRPALSIVHSGESSSSGKICWKDLR